MKYVFLFLSFIFLFTGCGKKESVLSDELSKVLFDTLIDIKIYDGTYDDKLMKNTESLLIAYDEKFSSIDKYSAIKRLNDNNGKPMAMDAETISLITKSIEYAEFTEGTFDISIFPLKEIWDVKSDSFKVPDNAEVEQALSAVSYENIQINGNNVSLLNDAQIDLGGIAKGHICDMIKAYLATNGVTSALVNLGGDITAVGDNNGEPFRIGIQKPFAEQNEIIGYVEISNASVVTSGTYERYKEVGGEIYHHILDPRTGYPSDSDVVSATVIAPSATDCDVIATAIVVLGADYGLTLVDSYPQMDCIITKTDGSIVLSSGFENGRAVFHDN